MTCNTINRSIVTGSRERAFTRTEVLIVVLILAVLGGMGALWAAKSKAVTKDSLCQSNLKAIGLGMAMYASENSSKVPIASVNFDDKKFIVWDMLLALPIRAELGRLDVTKPKPTTGDVGAMLSCPADTIPRVNWSTFQRKRSYAMPAHDMGKANWPPSNNNKTGVGLSWNWRNSGTTSITNFLAYSNNAPAVRLDMLQDAKATITITERVSSTNSLIGNGANATLRTTAEQLDTAKVPSAEHHQGKFNYLMADGHVELLLPGQTVGHTGQAGSNAGKHFGMWTIKAGD